MRLIVANCSIAYSGRLSTFLDVATRLLMIKADGTFMVFSDHGSQSVKPLNWMTPPTVIEEQAGRIVVRKRAGSRMTRGPARTARLDAERAVDSRMTRGPARTARLDAERAVDASEERLEIELDEVLSDVTHEMGSPDADVALAKDGVEAHLQELLAEQPGWCGEGLRLVRREWQTDIGPVDLMCREGTEGWVAVEIKRVAGIEAVEQLTRYLQRIRLDPAFGSCRGVLAAQAIKPQARVLAGARGIESVEVDLAVLRGEREPELKLFAA